MPFKHQKKRTRKPNTKTPKSLSREKYMDKQGYAPDYDVNYGIITKYHGCGGKCTVNILLQSGFRTFPNMSLKGSLKSRRHGQQLTTDSIVLVDDGVIVYVYKEDTKSVIDSDTLSKLIGKTEDDICFNETEDSGYRDLYGRLPSFSSDDEDGSITLNESLVEQKVDIVEVDIVEDDIDLM
uniref:Uncharacterized protein n=1 Tax=viral metagenome TaxID=1070528 RepID=A0A6C0J6P7_9ZZZZ